MQIHGIEPASALRRTQSFSDLHTEKKQPTPPIDVDTAVISNKEVPQWYDCAGLEEMSRMPPTLETLKEQLVQEINSLRKELSLSEVNEITGDAYEAEFSRTRNGRTLSDEGLHLVLQGAGLHDQVRYLDAHKKALEEDVEKSGEFFDAKHVKRTEMMFKDGYWPEREQWMASRIDQKFRLPEFEDIQLRISDETLRNLPKKEREAYFSSLGEKVEKLTDVQRTEAALNRRTNVTALHYMACRTRSNRERFFLLRNSKLGVGALEILASTVRNEREIELIRAHINGESVERTLTDWSGVHPSKNRFLTADEYGRAL